MLQGIVKLWYPVRGFGIIIPNVDGPDVFFHATTLENRNAVSSILPGTVVQYEQENCTQGLRATVVIPMVEFDYIKLPDECSHSVVVRNRASREVAVFCNSRDAVRWLDKQRPVAS